MTIDTNPGSPTADSYVSVAEADAYWSKRPGSAWGAAAEAAREGALVRATGYVDATYDWRGTRATAVQALDWPRYDVVLDGYPLDGTTIPARVKDAVCEMALKALAGDISADVSPQQVVEQTVGPITRKFAPNERNGGQKQYPYVDSLLRGLVSGGSGQIRLTRA
ncbi:DnaT-like ssDNA-binding protein [Cupriavidus nantongensis]|uniref:DnaT-like ssDNA-binding protein n=1 Tax=Cupriavidus nantongensis TaxID=1796606 RepID=UPI00358E7CC9